MKLTKTLLLMGALALGTTIMSAAPAGDSLKVNIPFSFVLSGKVFPAGMYSVQETNTGAIMVQGVGGTAIALTVPSSPVKAGTAPALHFTSTNGREYLVSINDDSVNHAIPQHAYETRTLTLSH